MGLHDAVEGNGNSAVIPRAVGVGPRWVLVHFQAHRFGANALHYVLPSQSHDLTDTKLARPDHRAVDAGVNPV
jgi:hypothetical protein